MADLKLHLMANSTSNQKSEETYPAEGPLGEVNTKKFGRRKGPLHRQVKSRDDFPANAAKTHLEKTISPPRSNRKLHPDEVSFQYKFVDPC